MVRLPDHANNIEEFYTQQLCCRHLIVRLPSMKKSMKSGGNNKFLVEDTEDKDISSLWKPDGKGEDYFSIESRAKNHYIHHLILCARAIIDRIPARAIAETIAADVNSGTT